MSIFQILLPYLALCGGILLEGESFLLAASISAHSGYMNIYIIIILTVVCTQTSDWFWFITGRRGGHTLLQKRPKFQKRLGFIYNLIDKYPYQVLFLFRFVYGFRSVMPLILGTSNVKTKHFFVLGLSSTIIWSTMYAELGYYFGSVVQTHWQIVKKYQYLIIILLILILISFIIITLNKWRIKSLSENTTQLRWQSIISFRLNAIKIALLQKQR
jgi:membrane protein DedA with SNARE-associated domain